jgi:hypothetical protein
MSPHPPPPLVPTLPPAGSKHLFHPPVLQFCIKKKKREREREKKKKEEEEETFLVVYNSYSRSFLVALLCLYVLWPNLVHLLYFSSFYLSPLLMVVSTSLKILYSFLYREYINHIHLLYFLLLPSLL